VTAARPAALPASHIGPRTVGDDRTRTRVARVALRSVALLYVLMILALPVLTIFWRSFEGGLEPVLRAIDRPAFQSAFWLTVTVTLVAVPINTLFGIVAALAIVRRRFPGRGFLNALIDLPFALSPVIIGLSLILVYGRDGWLGGTLNSLGFTVIFALPGMVLATLFVSLPFVVREVIPVLREIGTDSEEAAYTLGASGWRTFWRITLPAIRWGVIYGIILTTARSLGEYGAVAVVSGKIAGKTETLTTHVEERYLAFDLVGAYVASITLALMAVLVLVGMQLLQSGRLHRPGRLRRRREGELAPTPTPSTET
jgi:sulfate/thiosulfate transport system permease protein